MTHIAAILVYASHPPYHAYLKSIPPCAVDKRTILWFKYHGGNIWSGVPCYLLRDLLLTRTPTRDGMASGRDAQTSTMLGHSAGINHVGLCRPHHLNVQLLSPHGRDLPRPVRCGPERAYYPVVPYTRVRARGVRATTIASCITCSPGAYASTEGSLCLRLA